MNRTAATSPALTRGFTLIELMVTMGIVAILAAIAYPAYLAQVTRTNRNVAKACMAQYAQFLERYYTTQLTYAGADPVLACSTESGIDQKYTFSVTNLTASTYTVEAALTAGWSSRDSRCGTLTMDQAGVRGAGTGSAEDIAHCW